ncbi:MAG: hypothetical protein LBS12_06560, partial [Prevotellaceae bacterium]|nr:hypothetical protein [Prevotellaceae bacterium]
LPCQGTELPCQDTKAGNQPPQNARFRLQKRDSLKILLCYFLQLCCKVYGSIGTYAYGSNRTVISDAVYLCLKNTDGLMVFELSHVINNNQWDAIKEGIGRVIK